jgi:hypothetical protein
VATGSNEPGIDGAFISRSYASQLVNIIGVESVDDYLERAARAGATILRDKQEIPNVGFAATSRIQKATPSAGSSRVMEVRLRRPPPLNQLAR